MRTTSVTLAILALVACEYTPPDAEFETPLNVIAGTVAADNIDDPKHVILFATDAANPGPPAGTGRPVTFTTVPGSHFTDPTLAGLSGARWSITNVPDGDWLITGFMDMDNDFYTSTAVTALGGATCGDILGAHVADVATQALAPVSVSGGELADDVTVAIASVLTTERPAFTIEAEAIDGSATNGANISIATALDDSVPFPQQFKLKATGVYSDILGLGDYEYTLDGPFNPAAPAPCQVGFLARLADNDGDGVADELPGFEGNGLADMWPRVFLQYQGTTEEDGVAYAWAAQSAVSPFMRGVYEGTTDGVDNDGDGTVDEALDIPLNTQIYLPELTMTWLPGALKINTATGEEQTILDPSQIPQGNWSITVVTEAGQTWTLPNQLADWPSNNDAFLPARQAESLVIEP